MQEIISWKKHKKFNLVEKLKRAETVVNIPNKIHQKCSFSASLHTFYPVLHILTSLC